MADSSEKHVFPPAEVSAVVPDHVLPHGARHWWREWEVLALAVLVLGIYLNGISSLPLRGEESRWAQVAKEMLATGDWCIPRQQGEPFLSRPPMGSWLIAITTIFRGECDNIAVRLPTVLATLLTTLMIYGYSRTFLQRLGAFTAAVAYATMGQVLQLGGLAETESVFTLFVSSSFLIWHWLIISGRPNAAWMIGYSFAGLGALTKGLQAPIYFAFCIGIFLIVTRQWRIAFRPGHLLGAALFILILGSWQFPFTYQMGWEGTRRIWGSDVALRFVETGPKVVLRHLAVYPFELLACMMPWSIIVLPLAYGPLRRLLQKFPEQTLFAFVCLAVAFPSCWFPPGARGRYFMPLYPCFAILVGFAYERVRECRSNANLNRIWAVWQWLTLFSMPSLVAIAFTATWLELAKIEKHLPAFPTLVAYAMGVPFFAGICCWSQRTNRIRLSVFAFACFLGLTNEAIVMNAQIRESEDTALEVARIKQQLIEKPSLVSYGPIHHLFAFYFDDPIRIQSWPEPRTKVDSIRIDNTPGPKLRRIELRPADFDDEYFCFDPFVFSEKRLPFSWEKVAYIPCDRNKGQPATMGVVIGRRIPDHRISKSQMAN